MKAQLRDTSKYSEITSRPTITHRLQFPLVHSVLGGKMFWFHDGSIPKSKNQKQKKVSSWETKTFEEVGGKRFTVGIGSVALLR